MPRCAPKRTITAEWIEREVNRVLEPHREGMWHSMAYVPMWVAQALGHSRVVAGEMIELAPNILAYVSGDLSTLRVMHWDRNMRSTYEDIDISRFIPRKKEQPVQQEQADASREVRRLEDLYRPASYGRPYFTTSNWEFIGTSTGQTPTRERRPSIPRRVLNSLRWSRPTRRQGRT
jgi:hypothetical protein